MGLPNSWPDPEFVPKHLWGSRGRPGGVLEPLRGVLGASWGRPGGVVGPLGASGRARELFRRFPGASPTSRELRDWD